MTRMFQQPPPFIGLEIEPFLSWLAAVEALRNGHLLPRALARDLLVCEVGGELLMRAASIVGMGRGVKAVTVRPEIALGNPQLPTVQGAFILFDEQHGSLAAVIDGALLTKWKTVADSLLAASILVASPPQSLAFMGAGAIATALIAGYLTIFPSLRSIGVWSRDAAKAKVFADNIRANACEIKAELDPSRAVRNADVIACATGARSPILLGEWVKPGAYVDLIGAYRPDMREGDNDLMTRASIYVDLIETTVDHIGELAIPIAQGLIGRDSLLGDLYDLCRDGRRTSQRSRDITVFKNGGGAHLDLMIANYFANVYAAKDLVRIPASADRRSGA